MKPRTWSLALAVLIAPLAHAAAWTYVGSLGSDDPNNVFITSFTVGAPTAVTIQTWSFGGGTNAAGVAIPAGGFDPYLSLFGGTGPSATFIGSNDDGRCPPGHAASACADSTLILDLLPAGSYTLALSLPFNFSFAENYGSGTLGDGFIGLDASFDDGACAAACSNAYAFDISYTATAAVPEPASWALLGIGLALLGSLRRGGMKPVGACGNAPSPTKDIP